MHCAVPRTARRPLTSSGGARAVIVVAPRLRCSHRRLSNPFAKKSDNLEVELQPNVYDKTQSHYTGKILGIPTDTLMFYSKVGGILLGVYLVVWTFVKGYDYLTSFTLQQIAHLGFMAGFWTCAALFTVFVQLKRRYYISSNAVYNQAIALAMSNPTVSSFLGSYPKTGDFRAFCASGGFKLPLLRRIRAGTYELSDLLGTKQQRLQMMFVLKSDSREALVSCDVRKVHSNMFSSKYYFHSLAVNLRDDKKPTDASTSVIIIGKDTDVVYKGFTRF